MVSSVVIWFVPFYWVCCISQAVLGETPEAVDDKPQPAKRKDFVILALYLLYLSPGSARLASPV